MILFPNCKINLGLNILSPREDGFHEIETLMIPVLRFTDVLELTPADEGISIQTSGTEIDCSDDDNLCVKAAKVVGEKYPFPGVHIHLHKTLPFGAGLGGGSADAAFTIRGLNALFGLGISEPDMENIAAMLGSDMPFFIRNRPALATGRGEILEQFPLDLSGCGVIIIVPDFTISTREAYEGVRPHIPETPLREALQKDRRDWPDNIHNDFETHLFKKYPVLAGIKSAFYLTGAFYASLSGSGSAVYGLYGNGGKQTALAGMENFADLLSEIAMDLKARFPQSTIYHEVLHY